MLRQTLLCVAVTLCTGLPFGKKKAEVVVEEPSPSIMSEVGSFVTAMIGGFFAVDFVWRLMVLIALDYKFKLKEKLCKWSGAPDSVALMLYFLMWYVGNTYDISVIY